jgi:hypothetical protein
MMRVYAPPRFHPRRQRSKRAIGGLAFWRIAIGGLDNPPWLTAKNALITVSPLLGDPQPRKCRDRAPVQLGGVGVASIRRSGLFVPAGESHRFHDIVEALEVLVFFGPAEGSRAAK